jgi:predicted alpha/beta superfamily hydrolase
MKSIPILAALCIVLAGTGAFAQGVNTAYGTLIRMPSFHSKFVDPRNVDIWLPEKYDEGRGTYSVIYMQDGQNLFMNEFSTWNKTWKVDSTLTELMNDGRIRDCIVVGIWNTPKRSDEYFPEKAFNMMPDSTQKKIVKEFGGAPFSDRYLRFIIEELKPYIDVHYRVLTDRQHTFVMGSSKGGLISLYAALEYPAVFAGAGCVSTHWPGVLTFTDPAIPKGFAAYVKNHLPADQSLKLYFDYGTKTLDSAYDPLQQSVNRVLRDENYPLNMWVSQKFEGASHEENSWAARFEVPAKFLLGK